MRQKPKIGIFWIYKSKIYFKSIELEKVKPIDGFIDSDFAHYEVWNEIASQNRDFYLYEYEEIPRGRVVYDTINNRFIVYANEEIVNSDEEKGLIISAFGLENKMISFRYDEHYYISHKKLNVVWSKFLK